MVAGELSEECQAAMDEMQDGRREYDEDDDEDEDHFYARRGRHGSQGHGHHGRHSGWHHDLKEKMERMRAKLVAVCPREAQSCGVPFNAEERPDWRRSKR